MKWILIVCWGCAFACTDFVVQAKDGTLVNGRSLEFGLALQSTLTVSPKGQKKTSSAPNQKPGLTWVCKYGYLSVNAFGKLAFDGMNEAGLSFGYLWLPNITQYPTVASGEMKMALDFVDFCSWTLGNFATVGEVKEALGNVRIWGHTIPSLGMAPVLAAIHDAKGNHLVVEFVGGKMQLYDNPMSVLTNSPAFDWQMANLQNYLHLSPYNPDPMTFRGVNVVPGGQGGGLLGLPGDWTPPSRFVKIATLLRFAAPVTTGAEAVNLAEHLLNTVDIPSGTVREPDKNTGDYTQWIVIKDMTQRVFYFRSYSDLALKKVDLRRLNFARKNGNSLSLDLRKGYFDVTDALQGSKESMTVMTE